MLQTVREKAYTNYNKDVNELKQQLCTEMQLDHNWFYSIPESTYIFYDRNNTLTKLSFDYEQMKDFFKTYFNLDLIRNKDDEILEYVVKQPRRENDVRKYGFKFSL